MKSWRWAMVMMVGGAVSVGSGAAASRVTVKGSDTMVILGQQWAEQYMKRYPDRVVQVTGGGSGTGIAALINGATDIAQSSRPMKPKEREDVKKKRRSEVKEIAVALDGIAVYVHASNPLKVMTLDQLRKIYLGDVQNWKALGGPAGPLVTYGRENNSGTYAYFKEHVLKEEDFAPEVQTLPGTAAVINAVSKDKKAIGYGGIAYSKGVKVVDLKQDEGSPAIHPSMKEVVNGTYPISRSLYFYVAGEPAGEVKAFIDWILGPEGQQVCEKVGYYPLPKNGKKKK